VNGHDGSSSVSSTRESSRIDTANSPLPSNVANNILRYRASKMRNGKYWPGRNTHPPNVITGTSTEFAISVF
jgi:hypothetical protein